MKELSFDQINNKQIAVNSEIAISGYAFKKTAPQLIHTVRFLDRSEDKAGIPDIVVYAAKEGDTVWKVAKKYHTPVVRVRSVNDLADHEEIRPGSKILIVR
jgi:predicted Zn-dependent protease